MIRVRSSGNLTPAQIPFFNQSDQSIEQHGDHAEDTDTHQQPVEFKNLTSVDDHISKTFSATDKFSDDHAYQTKSDIDSFMTSTAFGFTFSAGLVPAEKTSISELND